jgi:hypothetical protein
MHLFEVQAMSSALHSVAILAIFCAIVNSSFGWQISKDASYNFDDSVGLGRQFDGIGGLSGGGVIFIFTVMTIITVNIIIMTTKLNQSLNKILSLTCSFRLHHHLK